MFAEQRHVNVALERQATPCTVNMNNSTKLTALKSHLYFWCLLRLIHTQLSFNDDPA